VSGNGISWAICQSAPRSRQITTPARHHSVFLEAGCPSCRPTISVKALKEVQSTLSVSLTNIRNLKKLQITTYRVSRHDQAGLGLHIPNSTPPCPYESFGFASCPAVLQRHTSNISSPHATAIHNAIMLPNCFH